MRNRLLPAFSCALLFTFALPGAAQQEQIDLDMVMRIRAEGFKRSKLMDTLWYLTDRYGPRLTNSPQQRRAAEWARDRLTEFGLSDAQLEPWGEFGLGWSYERCIVAMTAPDYMPLIAIPKAWTNGTAGEHVGEPVLIKVETEADLEKYAGKLAGKIVLNGTVTAVPSPFEALAKRYDAAGLADLARAPEIEEEPAEEARPTSSGDFRSRRALRDKLNALLESEGAVCVIEPDGGKRKDYGVITLGGGGSRDPKEKRALPQVVVSTEQFNRVARLLEHDVPVTMSVDVQTTFYDDDLQGHNIVAELPGRDLFDEVVMIGAHFDSWHPATGTTDNGCSCAVMIEAMRILKAVGAKPRRTIRVALWTGEEQGLLGSRGYVEKHFGKRETMELQPEHAKLSGYFNLDNGGGMIRGVYLQENAAMRPIFADWFAPFADLDATTITIRNTGGTDHQSFDGVGLPGFQFIQDPMDYSTRSHHTNMDTYERVHESDLQQSAVIIATLAYHAAMRDELLPRKPLPEPRGEERRGAPVEAGAARPPAPAGSGR